jgi:hypothetical protein
MKTVCVIGLGPSGLVAVKQLKNAGFDVMGFDRCSSVGGRWSLDEDHKMGVWKELCANSSRYHMEYSDFPWDAEDKYDGHEKAFGNIYPHCTEIKAYMEAYAKNFDLHKNMQLETEVKSIECNNNGDGGDDSSSSSSSSIGWKVVTTSKDGKNTTHEFDAIVVCNSAQNKAYHPLESKLKEFTGEVIHSKYFTSEKDYKGKRVLIIGGNVSGSEIISILAENGECESVTHSVRKMPYQLQKFTKNDNTCFDDKMFVRFPVWATKIVPDSLATKGLKMTVLEHWPEQCTESLPNCSVGVTPDIRKCGLTISKSYVDDVQNGLFQVKKDLASVNGKMVTFADKTEEEFDVIICATGYEFDMSFLPESVQEKVQVSHPVSGKKVLSLYKNTLVPELDTLAFCGVVNSVGPYFPLAEMQARYISAIWSEKIPRPSISTLQSGAAAATEKRLDDSSVLNQFEVATVINEYLGDELGVTPSYAAAMWEPKKYLHGPVYSCFYRINAKAPDGDEAVADMCRKRFEKLIASSPQVLKIEEAKVTG